MHIDAPNRTATLSVGEFASFTPYATPGFGGISAVWRAQLGTEWHQRIQSESAEAGEGMQDEVQISGKLRWRNWTLQLKGRIDQLKIGKSSTHLREIKTLSEPIPLSRESLLDRYLSYPIQLLTYRELLVREPSSPTPPSQFTLELLFVEIGSGLTQSLHLDTAYDTLLVDQLDSFVDFLESKQERLARLRSLTINPVYDTPRPGQEDIQDKLDQAFAQSKITLLEAPTGYGKTGVAWEYAARRLAAGQCDRVLYLTSKSTGQTEALTRLKALLQKSASPSSSAPATYLQIRNKQEYCSHNGLPCTRQTCPYRENLHEKWKNAGLQRLYLLSHDEIDVETLKAEGRSTGICPYELMRAALGQRDIWIGDYNYIFSPSAARLLNEQADFDPNRTFIIIDEAHNLPSRVQSTFSCEFNALATYAAIEDLAAANASRPLRAKLKIFASILSSVGSGSSQSASSQSGIDSSAEADFQLTLRQIASSLNESPLPYDDLQPDTLDLLFQIAATQEEKNRPELTFQTWSPTPGTIRLECIDASNLIASQLSQYNRALFLSATLSPIQSYLEEIGLDNADTSKRTNEKRGNLARGPQQRHAQDKRAKAASSLPHPSFSNFTLLHPPAPWRETAYDVAIDLRVDTRYKSRSAHLETTAKTIATAAELCGPAIAFFPSYAYAKQAYDTLQLKHPFLRTAMQPRGGGSLADRNAYLEETLAFHDALLLILGSSYAEGVDTLGGKAGAAIIVSPALPEMNFIQESKKEHQERLGNNGFERAYLHPGIQKVNQALGRLVRSPEHTVKALLHCQRFADPKTKQLLDPLYQSKNYIQSEEDLAGWFNPE